MNAPVDETSQFDGAFSAGRHLVNATRTRLSWPDIVMVAHAIAASYDTPVTLRQLYYRLVAAGWLPNQQTMYSRLSALTADARRNDAFPPLADLGRGITRAPSWSGPAHALSALARQYRVDRTQGQPCQVYIGVEKRGMLAQLDAWFGAYGLPVVALGGYSSQTLEREVSDAIEADGRPSVLLYAGDFDPSGEDIIRNFEEKVGLFDEVRRVALTSEQVQAYGLPAAPGKSTDTRAAGFVARHGELVQVELDALDPDDLRALYASAIDSFMDTSAFNSVLTREERDRAELVALARHAGGAT